MIPIVVITYNRHSSLKRLLRSLDRADYGVNKDIALFISVDGPDNEGCLKAAEDFKWKFGEKTVIGHDENLGLKKHVLECGDLSLKYGSIIMLEDDLEVSPGFYTYALQALEFAKSREYIGGISLYNHLLNVHVREPFYAIDDGYDNYYFSFASSWGQLYSKEMWEGFREWLKENDGKELKSPLIPANVRGWSERSWLKYNIAYLTQKGLYFLYPRVSLTTNHMEAGSHASKVSCDLQVPMMYGKNKKYLFSDLKDSLAVYDAFFENKRIKEKISKHEEVDEKYCEVDLYGYKNIEEGSVKRLLSSKPLPYRVIKSYGRRLRPIEANIAGSVPGRDFFLYDMTRKGKAPAIDREGKYLYNYRAIKLKEMTGIIKRRILKR